MNRLRQLRQAQRALQAPARRGLGAVFLLTALCLLPPPSLAPWGATGALLIWAAAALQDEVREAMADLQFWRADRLNLLDLDDEEASSAPTDDEPLPGRRRRKK